MYYKLQRLTDPNEFINVPHSLRPYTIEALQRYFPEFAARFHGTTKQDTLSKYYKRNHTTKIYEFRSIEAEERVAKLLSVKVYSNVPETEEKSQMSPQEIAEFKEYIKNIQKGLY